MGRFAIHPSAALARLIRDRRRQLGMSLREVQAETERAGTPIPYATLSKVEKGKVDPGVKRLHTLLRLYRLPVQLAADLLEMEDYAAELPPTTRTLEQLRDDGVRHWREGRLREGLACLLALRERQPDDRASKDQRHDALLTFAVAAKNLGKIRLAHQIVENLLLEKPAAGLTLNVLVLGATCWHALGSTAAALGFLLQAETLLEEGDHQRKAWIFHERARFLQSIGEYREAESALDTALRAYESAGDRYGACKARGSRIELAFLRGDAAAALKLAESAHAETAEAGFERLRILRRIDIGRAQFRLGERDAGIRSLQGALGEAVALDDHVLSFYGHHALWKIYQETGDAGRAELELSAARYYSRFLDERSPEVVEVRATDRPPRTKRRDGS